MPSLKKNKETPKPSPWPWRWSVLLCALTFPLLWVGGLVTSTDAGMAVPDWPSTYGYNMFAYPWQTWWCGPWDLLVEHGHRLLGTAVGMVAIVLAVAAWRSDDRRWFFRLTVAALLLVIGQGVLGGLRVVLVDRQLAMLHGCIGPLFFALTAVLVAATSKAWRAGGATIRRTTGGLFLAIAVFSYVQLFLGAQLRHVPEGASPWAFAAVVKLHLILAGVVALHVLWVFRQVLQTGGCAASVRRLTFALGGVLAVQLGLGVWTWLVKYGAPGWAVAMLPANMGATLADGWAQTHVATAHSACGSLILAFASAAAAFSLRFAVPATSDPSPAVTPAA